MAKHGLAKHRRDLLTGTGASLWLEHVERRTTGMQDFYSDILHAVKWWRSGDYAADDVLKAFRELVSKGPRGE